MPDTIKILAEKCKGLASPAVAGYAKAGQMESPRALARGAPRGAFSKAYGGAI